MLMSHRLQKQREVLRFHLSVELPNTKKIILKSEQNPKPSVVSALLQDRHILCCFFPLNVPKSVLRLE